MPETAPNPGRWVRGLVRIFPVFTALALVCFVAPFQALQAKAFPDHWIAPSASLLGIDLLVLLPLAWLIAWGTAAGFRTGFALEAHEARRQAMLCDLPLLLLPLGTLLYPWIARWGSTHTFSILGAIQWPGLNGFIQLPTAGYGLLLWAGPWVTLALGLRVFLGLRLWLRQRPEVWPKAWVLGLIGWAFFLGLSLWTTTVYPVTGDEPHYLLMTRSLLQEHDLDLQDNMTRADFRAFYPSQTLDFHPTPSPSGRLISKHFPALSLLVLPGYALLGRWGASATIALFSALIALLVFLLARDWGANSREALFSWGAALLCAPLATYFDLIYTEVPAALLLITAVWAWSRGGRWGALIMAVAAGLLPWLHIKYLALSLVLGTAILFIPKLKRADPLAAGGVIALLAAGFVLFFRQYYAFGVGDNPYGALHTLFSFQSLKNLIGLFVDRDYGWFTTAPVFLLAVWGIARHGREHLGSTLLVLSLWLGQMALFTINFDFTGVASVFSRYLATSAVLFLPWAGRGWTLSRTAGREVRVAAGVAVGLSLFIAWWAAAVPFLRYLSPKKLLWQKLGFVPSVFPGLEADPGWGSMLSGTLWLGLLAAGLVYAWRSTSQPRR